VAKAEQYNEAIVPGFTHLQNAQPVLLGHVLLAYAEMLERDHARCTECRSRINISPLGACALAGTALPTDPLSVADELGFDGVFSNSIDAVSDRDFAIETVFTICMIALHLSRLAEDWLVWSTRQFDFIDLDEAYCTGSSIMPQKKNPDVLELVRGRCGRLYGDLTALMTMFKGLPLAYNRDMQEDKEPLFDAVDTITAVLSIMAGLIRTTEFKAQNARGACDQGHMDATALADYLVGRGIAFREAHRIVGQAVRRAAADGVELSELSLEQMRSFSPVIADDVYRVLGAQNCVENYRSHGSSAPAEVAREIAAWKQRLDV
jgi:argininosuccinate lyase